MLKTHPGNTKNNLLADARMHDSHREELNKML
jgi:hypothetical protein